ncbi:CASP8 and FADD-like apoptosis regulator isoform X2 [Rana temporaria]|uniref:CASP8 and FADD-like apoptosis regulator isoform X2 n=1 Tax=Rana temporaria TaxID=8407 RepID=UPI001AAD4733|nr:CASP8 and FADD-like apoptosis regulator isoform X2 [Rana temporaria]
MVRGIAPNPLFFHKRTSYLLNADCPAPQITVMSKHCVSSATLLQVEEELEAEERDMILFACRDITTQTNVRELLSELNETKYVHGIVEVLRLVKRFDLLKKYLQMTKNEAEQMIMKQKRIVSEYSYLLVDINGQLEEEDLKSFLFLLKNQLRNIGNIKKTFLSLVSDMEKNNLISSENLDLLEQSFQTIHRVDLKNKILKFKQKGHTENGSHHCINKIAVPPPIPRKQVFSTFKHVNLSNGHKVSIPVQETSPIIQPVQSRHVPTASRAPQLQAEANDDRYPVRTMPLGFCLIIDCVGNDSAMLEHIFQNLHFVVNVKTYARIEEVKTMLQDVANMEQLKQYDIFICILISRGNADSLFFVDECSPGLPLDKIRNFFTGRSCPNLVGKPKLFFIQNYITDDCEVQHDGGSLEADGPTASGAGQERRRSITNTPNEADIFWSHCKAAERQLQRLSGSPSLYLKTLNDLLGDKKRRKHQDIQEIHTELNKIIYSKQNGYSVLLQHTLTKKLFIHAA